MIKTSKEVLKLVGDSYFILYDNNICGLFQPDFGCCPQPKYGWNTFVVVFRLFTCFQIFKLNIFSYSLKMIGTQRLVNSLGGCLILKRIVPFKMKCNCASANIFFTCCFVISCLKTWKKTSEKSKKSEIGKKSISIRLCVCTAPKIMLNYETNIFFNSAKDVFWKIKILNDIYFSCVQIDVSVTQGFWNILSVFFFLGS